MQSLASKVKSLALASKPQVLENCQAVLGSRTTLFFEQLKFCWKTPENLLRPFFVFFNFFRTYFACKIFLKTFFYFLENTCACVLDLGLERVCPWVWPCEGLSLEGLFLFLASDFFCVLGLKPCVLNSTSGYHFFLSHLCSP